LVTGVTGGTGALVLGVTGGTGALVLGGTGGTGALVFGGGGSGCGIGGGCNRRSGQEEVLSPTKMTLDETVTKARTRRIGWKSSFMIVDSV
jgi:hypothetical protein